MVNLKLVFGLLAVAIGISNVLATEVKFYELKSGNLHVNFTNFGARIVSLHVLDKYGKSTDVALGYDTVDEYKRDNYSFGAIVGRVANRIGGAKFSLDNTLYNVSSNDAGNSLNGGHVGFGNVIWKVIKHDKSKKSIKFQYYSFHKEQGFPGNLNVTATYTLQDNNKLKLSIKAKAEDKPTPVNLAQYTFWNLGGHNTSDSILHERLQVLASNFTELDQNLVPTGRILSVKKTPYDFSKSYRIGSRFLKVRNGYETDFVLDEEKKNENKKKQKVKLAAVLRDDRTGIVMKLSTDQPVVQFSTANDVRDVKGKGGFVYGRNSGVVLSAQGYPNAVNLKNFPSQILKKGKTYKQTTVFEFKIKSK